jgi:3-dehydroquinate synthase
MITQRVVLEKNAYDICIGDGLIDDFGALIRKRLGESFGSEIALITDGNVWRHYAEPMSASFARAGLAYRSVVLEPGEENKSLTGLGRLYDAFADMGLRRDGLVIAFGGGVVGDVTGFAAATWMRGVRYVQIPTTLLAQVDSGVGGKTAVNTGAGKNLVGTFYQPALVLADTTLLSTLPAREFRSGLAEVIKYGAIRSEGFFKRLKGELTSAALRNCVAECCAIKAGIVERDEFDTGERMLLNFGHSFGHVIEKLGGFHRYNHGEAVAMGMALAAEFGERLGLTEPESVAELRELLSFHGLETDCPYAPAELSAHMELDKKNRGAAVRLILLATLGEAFEQSFERDEFVRVLRAMGTIRQHM